MSGSRISQIQNIINDFKDIFDTSKFNSLKLVNRIKEEGNILYLPYVPQNTNDGLELADNVGYITIREEYINQKISYNYRFFSGEYEYIFVSKRDIKKDHCSDCFYFHFDKGDLSHLSPHVSVIMPEIRYPSKEMDLETFLGFIRDTFFTIKGGKFVRKNGNIWDNSFV